MNFYKLWGYFSKFGPFGPIKYYLGLLRAYKNVARVGPLKNSGPRAKFRVGLWPDPALDVSFEFDYLRCTFLYLHKLVRIKQLVVDSLGYLKGGVTVDLIRKLSRVLKSEMKFLET